MSQTSVFVPNLFQNKVVFVSGGATGIGFGIAQNFGKFGAKVAIMGRKQTSLDEATRKLNLAGIDCIAVQGDVRKPDLIEKALEKVVERFGRLDILVNNAAGNFMCSVEDMSYNAFQTVIEIDLMGTLNTSKVAFPYLKMNGGTIINISATLHYTGFPFQAHASSAKAGIDSLTQTLGIEWGEYGIRVVGIAPGPISGTVGGPEGRVFGENVPGLLGDSKKSIPVGRYGQVDDVAATALFLASPAASFITSTTVVVDGGQWHGKSEMYHFLKKPISSKQQKEKTGKKYQEQSQQKSKL